MQEKKKKSIIVVKKFKKSFKCITFVPRNLCGQLLSFFSPCPDILARDKGPQKSQMKASREQCLVSCNMFTYELAFNQQI